ncbi:hypothetical protein [Mycobacteroides abscessus]|uniref:hypothetical protein n=1 Tax=Mycobacteroides abscessus TaxID=36809 RepID=UPI00092AA417|nr:hypothetical protein [Mycobacteroides abscessus]QSM04925.1 hypothetical protein PROPHIGD91-4_74 [Mycobacterium phage prophi91-4]MDO3335170.1 hypothetical protein [Mycobacteroides abscessus subsp. bolletii]QSM87796.1 hypothetical protein I3U44_18530 [Mycobacteroides abscessus subsp. bolletii]SIB02239.1 Uncharacterised protein [Mycobacteroides abscessus subsp. bolletii]SII68903.1 Uncharacterised protein [Mycobacteroides abscessus subsp. bolletii]
MAATSAHQRTICDAITAAGVKITAHESDPGTTGAGLIATTPASFNTVWPAATDGSGGDAGYAVSQGSAGTLQGPAGKVVGWYGVWNGSTFLRGHALDQSITIGSNPVNFDITPKARYKGGQ